MKIDVRACALSCGILGGAIVFLTTLWLVLRGFEHEPIIFNMIYPGYAVTGFGSLVGLIYGFVDGAIIGILYAILYNTISVTRNTKKKNQAGE